MLTKPQVKYIQSLNDKKFRKEYGVFVAEGPKLIHDLLGSGGIEPVAIYALPEWWLRHGALKNTLPFAQFYELQTDELDKISMLSTPNQVLGIFKQPAAGSSVSLKQSVTLVLDGIQDPGNLGTIIRIADWFGLSKVIASIDSVDAFNPKVVQATMGSIARVNVLYEDLPAFVAKHSGIPIYASTLKGAPLSSFGTVTEGLFLIGNESKGISENLLQLATYYITIPRFGQAESLNAAVAAGIILSHLI
jgi:TrmH family RNA methyltransferase